MISGIIKVEVSVIGQSRRLRLITLTENLIIPDITKTESNNCFIIHCLKKATTNALLKRANRRDMLFLRRVRDATRTSPSVNLTVSWKSCVISEHSVGDVTKTGNGKWGMGNGEWDDSGEWEIKMGI